MEPVDIEGKTIDEAIQKACDHFGVAREKLHIEIVSEGTPGFLGLGAKKALIRAGLLNIEMTLDPPAPERPAHRLSRGTDPEAGPRPPERQPSPAAAPVPTDAPAVAPSTEGAVNGGDASEKAKRLLEGILERMGIPAPVTAEETTEAIVLNIRGDGSGLLIGKRGQNLDALQYIVNKAVHHAANGHKMIVVDTEAYRKRREESLVALALRMGEKVKKTKKQVTIGHMNARDRRLIHLAMQDDEALTTKSRGEGEYRKIIILPAQGESDPTDAQE